MAREDLDAIVLRRPANVAWYSCGGRTHILTTTELGIADVVVTAEGHEVVTAVNEASRLESEELGTLEATFTVLPWAAPRDGALPSGVRVGSDAPLAGARDIARAVADARRELTPAERERYHALGRDAAEAVTQAALSLQASGIELDAAAALSGALQARGIDPVVLLVAGSSRLPQHRHPLPTSAPLGDLVMLVACARRRGLIANLTRLVSLRPIGSAKRTAFERLLRVEATFIRATTTGRSVGDVFRAGIASYADNGFDPDEWQLHHQGGPTGYEPRDYLATERSTATVLDGQAFAWNPSVPGLKSEDTFVVAAGGQEIVTVDRSWPAAVVDGIVRPRVLER